MAMSITMIAVTAFLAGLSGAVVPGSLMTLVVNYSLTRGFGAGLRTVTGHAVLELLLLLVLLRGGGDWLSRPAVVAGIAVCGGIVLVWMGYTMIAGARTATLELAATDVAATKMKRRILLPECAGALVSATNPYWVLWWATIGITYLGLTKDYGLPGFLSFYLGHIAADFVWYGCLAALLVKGRQHINVKLYQGILICCGLFLLGLAVYFFVTAGRHIC